MNTFSHRKAVQALNFFARKEGGKIEKMKAIKLLWLSDRVHLIKYGRMITGDTYFALQHGPVASNSMDIINKNEVFISNDKIDYGLRFLNQISKKEFESIEQPDLKAFSKSDLEILELVSKKFGIYNSSQLRHISHFFTEWKRFENVFELNPKAREKMITNDFFENNQILRNYGITIDDEILTLNKEYFTEFA